VIDDDERGNTSTYVEKTFHLSLLHTSQEKHLHVRGEDFWPFGKMPCTVETPPRTWRRLGAVDHLPRILRNTSTYVEKTHGRMGERTACGKHLHVRGEDP